MEKQKWIYWFTYGEYKKKNQAKIGQTTRLIERIEEISDGVPEDVYPTSISVPPHVSDHDVHSILRSKGFKRIKREWWEISEIDFVKIVRELSDGGGIYLPFHKNKNKERGQTITALRTRKMLDFFNIEYPESLMKDSVKFKATLELENHDIVAVNLNKDRAYFGPQFNVKFNRYEKAPGLGVRRVVKFEKR